MADIEEYIPSSGRILKEDSTVVNVADLLLGESSAGGLKISSIPTTVGTVQFSQDLSVGALAFTTELDKNFILEEVELKFSEEVTEKITVTKIHENNNYSTIRYNDDTAQTYTNFVYDEVDGKIKCYGSENIKIECTNTGTTGIVYGTITYSY